MRLHAPALLLVPILAAMGFAATPAAAAAPPTVTQVDVAGDGPGDLIRATGTGFAPNSDVVASLDKASVSLPLETLTSDANGGVALSVDTRVPLAATPGVYRVTMTQAGGVSAASAKVVLSSPQVQMPLYALLPGAPADVSDTRYSIGLSGLANGPDVVRTVTVDGVEVHSDWHSDAGAFSRPGIGFAVPAALTVGSHSIVFTQTGPTPYTASGTVRVLAPSIHIEGSPTSSKGRLGVSVFDSGWDDVVDLQIVGAAGDVHAAMIVGDDSNVGAVITLPGVSAGLARITSVSRHNGATATSSFTVDPTTISAPTGLAPGHRVVNADGDVQLVMQTDGNLVLYSYDIALWNTHTGGHPGARLALQSDGNAVVYDVNGKALWNSGTSGIGAGARLGLDAADNAVITTSTGRTAWSNFAFGGAALDALTANHYLFKGQAVWTWDVDATMQGDGNLVVHVSGSRVAWSTRTSGHPNAYVSLQADGNLVVHAANGAVLWANYAKASGARLIAQRDGNVVEYASNGKAVWSTHTVVH